MKSYVVGFAFFDMASYFKVLLTKKNRPPWQEGKLNGLGGKINVPESIPLKDFFSNKELHVESPTQAMRREFTEESGLDIPEDKWTLYARLYGEKDIHVDSEPWEVFFFYTQISRETWMHIDFPFTDEILSINRPFFSKTGNDEQLIFIPGKTGFHLLEQYPHVPNLPWLIQMALAHEETGVSIFQVKYEYK